MQKKPRVFSEFSISNEIHSFFYLTGAVVNVAMPPTNESDHEFRDKDGYRKASRGCFVDSYRKHYIGKVEVCRKIFSSL